MGERGLRVLLAAFAAVGVLIGAYLTWTHMRGAVPICVGGGGGCETVQTSRYSEILGIPVALLGLFAYAGLLISAAIRGELAALGGFCIALVGTLFSAYLTYLELFVIQAICQWCVASAALVAACLLITYLRLVAVRGEMREEHRSRVPV